MNCDEYDALIFDCDGTLVDSLYAHETAWVEVLKAYRIPFTPERMNQLGGVPTQKTIEILAAEAGIPIDAAEVAAAKETHFKRLYPDSVTIVEPIMAIATSYRDKKPLGVATGSHGDIARHMLSLLGIEDMFGAIVGAEEVERHKPHPETYLRVARELGVVAEKCIAFDDSDNGLEAARRAGMTVVDVREIWSPDDRLFTA